MGKNRARPAMSLYQKFALVVILLGITPIALLSTVILNRMFGEYERSLTESFEQGLRYASYSLERKFDSYNDISKFSYYYTLSSEANYSYNFINYDNLRKILTGELYGEADEDRISRDMDTFLSNVLKISSSIESAHFVYEPVLGERKTYHKGNYNTRFSESDLFARTVGFDSWDRDSRQLIAVPTHDFDYTLYSSKRVDKVFTIARNYFNLTVPVGKETYVGTLLVDYDARQIGEIVEGIDLYSKGTLWVLNDAGDCFYSTDLGQIGTKPVLPTEGLLLKAEIAKYGLKICFSATEPLVDGRMRGIQQVMYIVVGLAAAALSLGSVVFSIRLTKPIRTMMKQMEQVESGQFKGELPVLSKDEIGLLSSRFNKMSKELENYTNQVYVAKIKQTEAELTALKSQIYPHFLFNTLEVIRMTAVGENDNKVAGMIEALGEQIHYLIGTAGDLVPLSLELANLEKYIYLINCRFQDKVSFAARAGGLGKKLVPKLALQPIVENAFLHGIKPKQGPGRIFVEAVQVGETLEISVFDNGVGMDPENLRKVQAALESDLPGTKTPEGWESIGLKNVHDRLRFLYGEAYGISLFSTPLTGTMVKAALPANIHQEEEKPC
ncbi:MAG: sensor histidine kinase [Clostridiales bacterium]|jgi:two-component system sensor histidine kinase YesM|nr:sensor histidine kinase [Clostridiales bacterium]